MVGLSGGKGTIKAHSVAIVVKVGIKLFMRSATVSNLRRIRERSVMMKFTSEVVFFFFSSVF